MEDEDIATFEIGKSLVVISDDNNTTALGSVLGSPFIEPENISPRIYKY